jgi:hypothetical protein
MMDYLRFSIPISITVHAPIDIVWDALTDIPHYPERFSGVASSKSIGDPYGHLRSSFSMAGSAGVAGGVGVAAGGGGANASGSPAGSKASLAANSSSATPTANVNSNSETIGIARPTSRPHRQQSNETSSTITPSRLPTPTHAAIGTKWKITRISVLENQHYSAVTTVTQYNTYDGDKKRSFTLSTGELLGATCSLKFIVERADGAVDMGGSGGSNRGNGGGGVNGLTQQTYGSSEAQQRQKQPSDTTTTPQSPNNTQFNTPKTPPSCRVTIILTMIPYQFFVKLLGVMCCLCLLKYRARIAMECDLEDLVGYCEERYERETRETELQQQEQQEVGRLKQLQQQQGATVSATCHQPQQGEVANFVQTDRLQVGGEEESKQQQTGEEVVEEGGRASNVFWVPTPVKELARGETGATTELTVNDTGT